MFTSCIVRVRAVRALCIVLPVFILIISGAPGRLGAQGLPAGQAVIDARIPYAVAVDGDRAVVGAQWHDGYRGAAYVLRREGNGWSIAQRLSPGDLGEWDHFGGAVAIAGDRIVVGATWQDLFRGAAYVYELEGGEWILRQKLAADGAAPESYFGAEVSVSGDALTVASSDGTSYRFEQAGGRWAELGVRKGEPPLRAASSPDLYSTTPDALAATDVVTAELGAPPLLGASAATDTIHWVNATDGTFEDRVEITWEDVGRDDIIYKVLRGTTLLSVVSSDDTRYSDTTGELGTEYTYCVVIKYMTEPESTPVCNAGSRIIFSPGSVTASFGLYTDRVALAWIDRSGINEGYRIYRDSLLVGTAGPNASSFSDTDVQPGDTLYYEVAASVGAYESQRTGADGMFAVVLPPRYVSASDGQYYDRVVITWDDQADDEAGYRIYREDSLIAETGPDVETYEDAPVGFGESYEYCVVTIDGLDVESIPVCDEGKTGLDAPENVSASDGTYDDRVRITWDDISDYEDGYEIARAELGLRDTLDAYAKPEVIPREEDALGSGQGYLGDAVVIGTTGKDAESFDDLDAQPGMVYEYSVKAVNNLGGYSTPGTDSGSRSFVIAPYNVKASDGTYEERTYVTWESASTTTALFMIYRDGTFIKSVNASQRYYNDIGGVAGLSCDYTVYAVSAIDSVSPGAADTGRRELRIPTPVTAGDNEYENRVVISWADNSAVEDGYRVYRRAVNEILGSCDTPGYALGVAISGDYAYVADYSNGLQVIDISDPASPSLAGSYDTPGDAVGVAISGGYAYVADGSSGLQVIYIGDPASPSLAGSYDTPGSAQGVAISGDYAYVADVISGLQVIDISDPASPALAGSYDTPGYAVAVALSGDHAFVADGSSGLQVIDISDPTSPSLAGIYDTPGNAQGVAISGDHAYLADGTGLLVMDISDPASPSIAGSYDTPGDAFGVAIWSGYACVTDGSSGLQVVESNKMIAETDPNRTSFIDSAALSGVTYEYSVAAYDTTAGGVPGESQVGSDQGARLLVAPTGVQASDGTYENRVVITWNDNSNAEDGYYIYRDAALIDSTIDNHTTYTDLGPELGVQHVYSVAAFDMSGTSVPDSDPGSTRFLSPVYFNASDVYSDRIELTWIDRSDIEDGYRIFRKDAGFPDYTLRAELAGTDITSFTDMYDGEPGILRGRYDTPGTALAVAVVGGYAYVADGYNGLQVIDVSDPSSPELLGTRDTPGYARGVAVRGKYAYVADFNYGLQIIDISDPVHPTLKAAYDTPGSAYDIALAGDYAYVADYYSLQVIDVSDSLAPALVWTCDTPGYPEGVALAGDSAYVADSDFGLQVIDISDPLSAHIVGTRDTPYSARDVAVAGGYAYVADYNSLQIIDVSDPLLPIEGSIAVPSFTTRIAVDAGFAYLGNGDEGLRVIDISDPTAPEFAWSYPTTAQAYGVAVAGSDAYVCAYSSGLWIVVASGTGPRMDEVYDYRVLAYRGDMESDFEEDDGIARSPVTVTNETEVITKLFASDEDTEDWFGYSVSISGNYAIVGDGDRSAAYIFERDASGSWIQKTKLTGDGSGAFGQSVSISGDRAIVGARWYNNMGAAYIYECISGAWQFKQKIVASDPASNMEFGSSVAIDGDRAIVGAQWDGENGTQAGAAYIFERDGSGNWPATETRKIMASGGSAYDYDYFGCSVSISGDHVIVGAYGYYMSGGDNGSAYIFVRDGNGDWNQACRLHARQVPLYYDYEYGKSVSISGNLAVVGDPGSGTKGSVYIHERNADGSWPETETQRLLASDAQNFDRFGVSVSLSSDRLVVGKNHYNLGDAGAAYVFERDAFGAWRETHKLVAGDGESDDAFGAAVAVSGNSILIGAYMEDERGLNAGAAYLYDISGAGSVAATDGTQDSRIRVSWDDVFDAESGFIVYRDGELYDANIGPNIEVFNDADAQRGRTYEYRVKAVFSAGDTLDLGRDFGWRPANGSIAGLVTTRSGAGVPGISVVLDPAPTGAYLFDGVKGRIRIEESDPFNFDLSGSYTVEAWIRYSRGGDDDQSIISKAAVLRRFPFELRTDGGGGYPGRLVLTTSDGSDTVSVESDVVNLDDNEWHHVACVYNADLEELNLYVDGAFSGGASTTGLGDVTNEEDLFFGFGRSGPFHGMLDEVRIWSTAKSDIQIQGAMNLQVEGDEPGLVGYWKFDEEGGAAIADCAGSSQYGIIGEGVIWTDETAPLDFGSRTDIEGNYILSGLRYESGDTLFIRPSEGDRQFQPAFKAVLLTEQSPVANDVGFAEITSYTVTGRILLAGTDCPAANVSLLVDGNPMGVTDKNGKFSVSIDNLTHLLSPESGDYEFDPPRHSITAKGDTTVDFSCETVRTLAGSAGGGCGRYVGDITITIESQNGCLQRTVQADSAGASYSVELPPQVYLVRAEVEETTIPAGLNVSEVVSFFQNLGSREIDLTDDSGSLDFVYRANLIVTIEGFEDYIPACGRLVVEGDTLPAGLPVLPQLEVFTLSIHVDEYYGPNETCPLDTGMVVIYDEISDRELEPVPLYISNGTVQFPTFGSTPSFVIGRTDGSGNNRSYQKSITVYASAEGRTADPVTEWALVTGHLAGEGTEFVSFTSDPMPLFILRDPPGDNSYAYIEEGFSKRSTITWDQEMFSHTLGVNLDMEWGLNKMFFYGVGMGEINAFKATFTLKDQFRIGLISYEESKTEQIVSTTERYATSSSDLFIGESGDVFVGAGFNFLFSRVNVLETDGCDVVRSVSYGFQPDTVWTVFTYSQYHIENVLIPELNDKYEYYTDIAPDADSAKIYFDQAEAWQEWVDWNREKKKTAITYENRSFSAGADFTSTSRIDDIESFSKTLKLRVANEVYAGKCFLLFGAKTDLSVGYEYTDEKLYDRDEWTETESNEVGYVLSDDDIGDNFTVDLKNDGKYRSPVFDVRAGMSSCPYEAWPDSSGTERMVPRDGAGLFCAEPSVTGVPAGEPAVFDLEMTNTSQSDEARLYTLRLVGTSNPDGLVVKANGALLNSGLDFFLPPGEAHDVTVTVERGPVRYSYDTLEVMLYPPCEYANWENGGVLQRTDVQKLYVSFEAPCSEIALYGPLEGWRINASSDSLVLRLNEYDLSIGEGDEGLSIEYVGFRYRRLGEGQEGPGEWSDPELADYLGNIETRIAWMPDGALRDGVYELQAFAHCENGEGYSRSVAGTIDRHAPAVFGVPEPSDGILSFGEAISVTFNEAIDCEAIDPAGITLTWLDGTNDSLPIPHGFACNGAGLVITPTVAASLLEGRLLEASVAGVADRAGNVLAAPVVWEFAYRASQFAWTDADLVREAAYLSPGSFTAELVNGTGRTVTFSISDKPDWIASIVPASGTILPGEKLLLELVVQEDLAIGSYEDEVTATAVDDQAAVSTAVLALYLDVTCQAPAWVLDPGEYEHTMTIVAKLKIGEDYSTDEGDMVAAFVGGELRGVASVDSVPVFDDDTGYPYSYLAFLSICGNRPSGETVRFRVWDASECVLYGATAESVPFAADAAVGSPDDPIDLTALEVIGDGILAIDVVEGWNWISTNILTPDMSVTQILADLNLESGDLIKSQAAFSQFVDPETGWTPAFDLDNVSGYLVNLSRAGTILHEGAQAPLGSLVPVSQGWNWIGYLPQGAVEVDTALVELVTQELLSDDDMIKSQDAFALYHADSAAWYGSLTMLEPGRGYKLYLGSVSGAQSFAYHEYESSTSPPAILASAGSVSGAAVAGNAPAWTVDPHAYQFNMTVTAVLRIGELESIDGADMIGAFVGGECRGVAQPVYVGGVRRYLAFMMIHSNEAAGETVTFRAFDADAGEVLEVEETLVCEADAVRGTVRQPVVLNTTEGGGGTPEVPRSYALYQNVPNPFNPATTIRFDLPEAAHVRLAIYNVKGELVSTVIDRRMAAGRREVTWQGTDKRGGAVSSGVYFYRLVAGEFVETRKMVLLR